MKILYEGKVIPEKEDKQYNKSKEKPEKYFKKMMGEDFIVFEKNKKQKKEETEETTKPNFDDDMDVD